MNYFKKQHYTVFLLSLIWNVPTYAGGPQQ